MIITVDTRLEIAVRPSPRRRSVLLTKPTVELPMSESLSQWKTPRQFAAALIRTLTPGTKT